LGCKEDEKKRRKSQRQSSHNQGLRNPNSKDYNYLLYKFCRENNVEKIICELIETVDNENIFIKEQEYMDLLKPTLNHYRAFQTEEQKIEQKKEHTKIKANCPECGKEMIKNNINRHIRDIH
tara:strand:- start:124 stop:489 length:366 start_codon:yes stop_codon:yes gene_type:complete